MTYTPADVIIPPPPMVSPFGRLGIALDSAATAVSLIVASATWPAAKRVIYMPIYLDGPMTLTNVWWVNGATASTDNVECGVYTSAAGMPVTKLISNGTGTTAATANALQSVDVTDTVIPGPGLFFLALTISGTTTTVFRANPGLLQQKLWATAQELTGSFGLPTTATPVTTATTYIPLCGFATVTTL